MKPSEAIFLPYITLKTAVISFQDGASHLRDVIVPVAFPCERDAAETADDEAASAPLSYVPPIVLGARERTATTAVLEASRPAVHAEILFL
jgi:hypothetical protein